MASRPRLAQGTTVEPDNATISCPDIIISHLMASVSWLSLPIENHVFYLALGSIVAYLPYANLAKGLASGFGPDVDRRSVVWRCYPVAALGHGGLVQQPPPGRAVSACGLQASRRRCAHARIFTGPCRNGDNGML